MTVPGRRSRLVFGAVLALGGVLVVLALLANARFVELARANRWSLHTHQVLTETAGVEAALSAMETAFRGFALTGEARYRQAWSRERAVLESGTARLGRLTSDNPAQQRRVAALVAEYRAWLGSQAATGIEAEGDAAALAAARAAAADPAQVAARASRSASLRALARSIQRDEFALLRARAGRAARLERVTRGLMLAGSAIAFLLAVAAAALVHRRTAGLRRANEALEAEAAQRALAARTSERLARQNALILSSAADGIYGIDAHGFTTFLNPAAAGMLGYDAEELTGRPYEATLLSHAPGGDPIRAALHSGEPVTVRDATFRRADGRRFPVEYTVSPIVEEERIAGAVITFRDVTLRREVDRMKDEFVSVVSHELRTPLTSIRGSLGLLAAGKGGELSSSGARMLEIAVANTDRLIRLINDILDLERIESGKEAMEMEPVSAAEVARHAAEVMHPVADRAGVALRLRAEDAPLVADADRLLQVITNLLSNAIKFSEAGGAVELAVERGAEGAVFRVADGGRGIPADRLESIFERFHQVDSSDSRQKGGTGLGLAICRSIVQQHGGRIWAESEPGRGSTFVFTLPVRGGDGGKEVLGP
ncbi:MAG TPA: ATP-binding protein [Longimicrobium sp.]|nr:ATP-binding protein [Longimicrobium sp.]